MDIRCVRIIPYDLEGRVLLDVQQVLPLPEAADYQVRLRRKDAAAREQARSGGRDFTRYHVVVEGVALPQQNKRNAVRTMVEQLAARGVALAEIRATLPNRAMRMLKGIQRDGDAVRDALVAADPGVDLDRWFCDDALADEATETTYVVSKMWGLHTEPTLASLTAAFPDAGVSFRRAETPDDE